MKGEEDKRAVVQRREHICQESQSTVKFTILVKTSSTSHGLLGEAAQTSDAIGALRVSRYFFVSFSYNKHRPQTIDSEQQPSEKPENSGMYSLKNAMMGRLRNAKRVMPLLLLLIRRPEQFAQSV